MIEMSKSRTMESASRLIVALLVVLALGTAVGAFFHFTSDGGCGRGIDCSGKSYNG